MIAGERLPLCRMRASDRDECRVEGIEFRAPGRIRAIPGPQDDYVDQAEIAKFFGSEYTVQTGSDRLGMRLQGEAIRHAKGFNIASDATAPGSVQVPGNGQPIVLMADRQTIGGYPKIATVISADLPALGRLSIGSKVVFEQVTIEGGNQALRRSMLSHLDDLGDHIVPLGRTGADVPAPLLFNNNLISGVVDADPDHAVEFLMGKADTISSSPPRMPARRSIWRRGPPPFRPNRPTTFCSELPTWSPPRCCSPERRRWRN